MTSRNAMTNARAQLCAQVEMTVAPHAAAGISRAYPVGHPTLVPMAESPCAPSHAARYLLRQTFVAEIPIAVSSNVCASVPRVRPVGCPRACLQNKGEETE